MGVHFAFLVTHGVLNEKHRPTLMEVHYRRHSVTVLFFLVAVLASWTGMQPVLRFIDHAEKCTRRALFMVSPFVVKLVGSCRKQLECIALLIFSQSSIPRKVQTLGMIHTVSTSDVVPNLVCSQALAMYFSLFRHSSASACTGQASSLFFILFVFRQIPIVC